MAQISKSADVIFHASGSSGLGVFDAVEEKKVFAIGVDSNQNWVKPGRILTSMIKRVDLAVFNAIEAQKANQFKAGLFTMGIAGNGIDYALDNYNRAILSKEVEAGVNAVKKQILDGKLRVPDYYLLQKSKG